MPSPVADSMTAGSTEEIPACVFRRIGRSAYTTSAAIAVRAPIPPMRGSGIRNPKRARLGIVWTTFAKPRTGRARRGRRVSATPSGTPIATASAVETRTRTTCSPVSATISVRRSQK
jgi:hypothetical protein